MKYMVREKRLARVLIMLSLLLLISATEAPALFGPEIIDVTNKAFSVVWTTDSDYSSCGIGFYTDNTYMTLMDPAPGDVIVVTSEGHPGRNNHIAMVSVVRLDYYTTYYFRLFLDGNVMPFYGSVRTERLRGVSSYDEGTLSSDIVSNDVVHKAIYKPDGTSPALGVLVLAEILDPILFHANPNDPDAIISDHPISAWVGEGMIGDETATEYNPNNISYKQYAALNMNNLFDGDRYPLSLHGDDPDTKTINEGEIVRFTILHGEQDVLGSETNQHSFISYGHIGVLDITTNGDKLTTGKISASFRLKKGVNLFAFPCKIPSGFTTGDLWFEIEKAEGKEGIVESIYVFDENIWLKTFKTSDPVTGTNINNINPLQYGDGAFVIMNQDMTKEVSFYGKPESLRIDLFSDEVNMVAIIPQTPLFYETRHFLNDIESAGAGENSVENIWFYDGGWKRTYKIDHPLFGPQIQNSVRMSNIKFYVVIFKDGANDLLDFDPFAVRQKRRLRSLQPAFFY